MFSPLVDEVVGQLRGAGTLPERLEAITVTLVHWQQFLEALAEEDVVAFDPLLVWNLIVGAICFFVGANQRRELVRANQPRAKAPAWAPLTSAMILLRSLADNSACSSSSQVLMSYSSQGRTPPHPDRPGSGRSEGSRVERAVRRSRERTLGLMSMRSVRRIDAYVVR